MAGSKSDYLENKLLDLAIGGVAFSPAATLYAALFTTAPSDAGGGSEFSGVARVAITNNTTNFPSAAGGAKSNGVAIAFAPASAAGTVEAVGLFDAASGGNLYGWAELLTGSILVATAKAATDVFTSVAHGLANGDAVRATSIPGATALPSPLAERTTYYVVGAAADTFQLSATPGGSAVNLTTDGAAMVQKTNFKAVAIGDIPSFAIGALTFSED